MLELSAEYSNTQQLYRNYMPFVTNGGLFFPSFEKATIGETASVSLLLPDDIEAAVFEAKVIWINPKGAHGGRPAGIGIGFNDSHIKIRSEIEKLLNRKLNSTDTTATM